MKVKVKDIVEAARKNGLRHARSTYYDYNEEEISACIMGQAYYNLTGIDDTNKATELVMVLDELTGREFKSPREELGKWGLGTVMTLLNDYRTKGGSGRYRTYSELVKAFETRAKPYLNEVVEIPE